MTRRPRISKRRICAPTVPPPARSSHSPAQLSRGLWHGDGRNRWFDSTLQFIVFENGKVEMLGVVVFLLVPRLAS